MLEAWVNAMTNSYYSKEVWQFNSLPSIPNIKDPEEEVLGENKRSVLFCSQEIVGIGRRRLGNYTLSCRSCSSKIRPV